MIKSKTNLLKTISIATLSVSIMTLSEVPAFASWKQNSVGWWYDYDDSSSYAIGWKNINNTWYFFDENGYMKTGWLYDNGTWYYLDKSGAMKTGWIYTKENWYFLDSTGAMQTGWVNDNGTWYYFRNDGSMRTGWVREKSTWYFLNIDGSMATGWTYIGNNGMTYFYDDGSQAQGWFEVDGKTYYSNPGSVIATSCVRDDYLIDEYGVRLGKLKCQTEEEAKALIEKEDSVYLNNIKSKVPDFELSSNYRFHSYMPGAKDFLIREEPSFKFTYVSKSSPEYNCIYYVGSYSGKVYSSKEDSNRIYQIEDNKIVKVFDNDKYVDTDSITDWR